MSDIVIEDLLMIAAENASPENLDQLVKALKQVEKPDNDEIAEQLELVFESFEEEMSAHHADFCLDLARINVKDNSVFRKVLTEAIKKTLPPYLNKLGFLRALGLRNKDISLGEIVSRYENMLKMKNNMLVFFENSKRWGRISDIDAVSASVAVNSVGGGAFAVPLEVTLSEGRIFDASPDSAKLASFSKNGSFSGAAYRSLASEKAVIPLDEKAVEKIAYATAVPSIMTSEEFKTWWASTGGNSGKNAKGRQYYEARSIQELHVLLGKCEADDKLDEDGTEKLVALFTRLNSAAAVRDIKVLAESISTLTAHGNDEQLARIFKPLIGKVPFWPESLDSIHLEALNIWGDIQAKHIPNLAQIMKLIFPDEYLAAYTICLPLRCLNAFGEIIDDDLLYDTIKGLHMCSCDILLWIWRNRKKHDEELVELISIEQVAKALSADKLPKAWTGAQRDLKKQLIDKKDFQEHLLNMVGEDIWRVTSVLQTADFCTGSERQSLLIKLSRLSKALRDHLEGGAGERALGKQTAQDTAPKVEPLQTSIKSHRNLLDELQELINVHIPENREALKTARAHGDFRENAEYDAAKERRNFLNRRRDELERDILLVQPIDFEKIEVEEYTVIGSAVTISYDSGENEKFFLVGAWDGNPDENMVSYKTKMGDALMHHKVDDKVTLPNGSSCVITKVEKLPESIIEKFKV